MTAEDMKKATWRDLNLRRSFVLCKLLILIATHST